MILRIVKFLNKATTQVEVQFSENLDPNIGISNVRIISDTPNIPNIQVRAVVVDGAILRIEITPQFAFAFYTLEFISSSDKTFESLNGNTLQEDGIGNAVQFLGLENPNTIRDTVLENISPVYDVETPTLIRNYLSGVSDKLFDARNDIRETGNANFLEVEIVDEQVRRGPGPVDRLANEGAYQVTRVATTQTGSTATGIVRFEAQRAIDLLGITNADSASRQIVSFSADPVSLKSVNVIRETVSNAELLTNKFDQLLITVANVNVIQLHSVTLITAGPDFVYDIPRYGYAITDNRYDTLHGNNLRTLSTSQIRLSDQAVVDGEFAIPTGSDELEISYSYINNGINVEPGSLVVSQVKQSVRKPIGAFQTVFSLDNFPVVNSSDQIPSTGGVSFLDPAPPSGAPFTSTHPAFSRELVFSETRLPATPGEYSIEYSTGRVFVFGAVTNNGTGSQPPVATYHYRKVFVDTVDYSFDPDTEEIAANSSRNLAGEEVRVGFRFENVLAVGIDYTADVHHEAIDERLENRLVGRSQLRTLNFPITNVFRAFNETTGENYAINRFDKNYIYIDTGNPPRVSTITNELVEFERVFNETLFITEELVNTGIYKIVRVDLFNSDLTSQTRNQIASNVNTDVLFTDEDLFEREFFYDNILQTLSVNLAKLSSIGDYLIDYRNGVIYAQVAVATDDLGQISYSHSGIRTQRPNILSVDRIAYKPNIRDEPIATVEPGVFTPEVVTPQNLPASAERFLLGNTSKPILLGAKQYGIAGQRTLNSDIFVALDAVFQSSHADGNHILRFDDDADRLVLSVISMTAVRVDVPFTDNNKSVSWCLVDGDFADGYTAVTTYPIQNIRGVYSVTELQTLDKDSLTNFFNPETDTFTDNVISFNNPALGSLLAGEALAIDYSFGNLYIDYMQVFDSILISYEYGDNSINHSISGDLPVDTNYFVNYKYGALREPLLTNFGSLTQIDDLTNFPLSFDRELYRDAVSGALQAFANGPTKASVSTIVSSITDVDPEITELTFNEWTVGRDNLYLQEATITGDETYEDAHFGQGLIVDNDTTLSFPAEAYVSLREGTFEAWAIPQWRGIDNDATLTFDIGQDGYSATAGDGYGLADGYLLTLSDIYIGASAFNPTLVPFSIARTDPDPNSPIGRPANFGEAPGYFIWYDEDENKWKIRFVANPDNSVRFTGELTTSGQFYNVADGYNTVTGLFTNELNDSITSAPSFIRFDTFVDSNEGDGYDGYIGTDGYSGFFSQDGIDFISDDFHYLFDTGPAAGYNRLAIFKDGSGYLNFRAYDNSGELRQGSARLYNISANISDWVAGGQHFIAASWRFNSAQGIDEMHLFIDGQEVSNNFKYGGRPLAAHGQDIYRTVADEVITSSAAKTIIGRADGISTASSAIFTSATANFLSNGITAGDTFHILDETADGAATFAAPHLVVTVDSEQQITLDTPLTLTLGSVAFSMNLLEYTAQTSVATEEIAVFTDDGYTLTELDGLLAESPDYFVERVSGDNVLSITDNVVAGEGVFINTLGLTRGRVRDTVFKYDGYEQDGYNGHNILDTNLAPPVTLDHVDIFKYIFRRTAIQNDGYALLGDGFFSDNGTTIDGYFTEVCQPSNTVTGKSLKLTLSGTDLIDFAGVNQATITGDIAGSPGMLIVPFTSYGSFVTDPSLFTAITDLDFTFTPSAAWDGYGSIGAIEVIEEIPFTESESGGTYAQVVRYDNGSFTLHTFGTGGEFFELESCFYLFDYPTALNISITQKGKLFIGSDIDGNNQFDGTLDQVIFLNEMLTDIRSGEIPPETARTITQDYNSLVKLKRSPQTMMQLDLDGNLNNIDVFYTTYEGNVRTSSNSVNTEFGDSAVIFDDQFLIDNGQTVFNNSKGSIEFWMSPMIDILNDESHIRYYIDISSARILDVLSTTAITLLLPQRARKVESIRLITDNGTGTDFFDGGELGIDGKFVRLGTRLPAQKVLLRVTFIPIDSQGDRVSIYKDGYGTLNFEIKGGDIVTKISYPISWGRNTWHRVMATWDVNNLDNRDRMRLFVDGVEGGTILYGSPGVLYGIGLLYGQAAAVDSNFLTTNIDLTDTFSDIIVGNSFNGLSPGQTRLDNLRFSNQVREPATIAGSAIDLNFNANIATVFPVIEDDATTAIYDFNKNIEETQFLANVLNETTPLFLFDVDVIDSFRKIQGNQLAQDIIVSLINRLKPAHTEAFIQFIDE